MSQTSCGTTISTTPWMMRQRVRMAFRLALALILSMSLNSALAEPFAAPGDLQLRHDIEYLADRGLITVPITSWPMTWADIAAAVGSIRTQASTPHATRTVIARLENRLGRELAWGFPEASVEMSVSDNRTQLRGFEQLPRGSVDLSGILTFTGESIAGRFQVTVLDTNEDGDSFRFDGSYLAYIFGNTAVSFGAQEQWWGPGHAGSLILSNNARPVPGLTVRRNVSLPFKNRWLRWIGPWSAQLFIGQLESDRVVSKPYLLGARAVIKPFPSLEVGLSRTAQWGGEGRPESFDTLVDLIIGRDNLGDGVTRAQEPGNQLAGFDARFSTSMFSQPVTLYGQLIGEDEAGGFPSRYIGQFGISSSTAIGWANSTVRMNLEYSDTTCQFYENSRRYNCAYNHAIYRTGYRFRGRSIGHSSDNDARQLALITTVNYASKHSLSATLRAGTLNRGGRVDERNTLTSTPADFFEIDFTHTRPFYRGRLDVGVGYHMLDREVSRSTSNDLQISVKWNSREF